LKSLNIVENFFLTPIPLRLLADKAFYDLKLNEIADDFPADRVAAEKAFKKIGFVRKNEGLVVLTRRDYEAN
jgi:hypothetical protein